MFKTLPQQGGNDFNQLSVCGQSFTTDCHYIGVWMLDMSVVDVILGINIVLKKVLQPS